MNTRGIPYYSRFPRSARITDDVVISHLLLQLCFRCLEHLLRFILTVWSSVREPEVEGISSEEWCYKVQDVSLFRPQGNGQCERINGSIQKAIQLARRTYIYNQDKTRWEEILPVALSSLRSLLCTATNCIPHDRIFAFQRSSAVGSDLPDYLLQRGEEILHRKPNYVER